MMMNRRTALAAILSATTCVAACLAGEDAQAHPATSSSYPVERDLVSIEVERPGGGSFPHYWQDGREYVAGEWGQRYDLRVTNHSGNRVEVVVTVDGRDVITGQLGNYRKQRGYVIAPYDSVTIDGYRQSMDHVAAFRFTDPGNSYSSRMGNARDVGVIGVAVFQEEQPYPSPRPWPRRPLTHERDRDNYDGRGYDDEYAPSSGARKSESSRSAPHGGASPSADAAIGGEGWAEPAERQQLGTEYGETTYSSVRETTFTRRNKRRPDRLFTVVYDSMDGLRARGVIVDYHYDHYDHYDHHDHYHHPPYREPEPFPERRFSQPPPRRY